MISQRIKQLKQIEIQEKNYQNNYEYQMNFFFRRVLFLQTLKQLKQVRNRLNQIEQQFEQDKNDHPNQQIQAKADKTFKQHLDVKDIPQLKFRDSAIQNSKHIFRYLQQDQDQSGQITKSSVWKAIFLTNKRKIIICFIYFLIECLSRLSFSFVLYYLFSAVANFQVQKSYILAVVAGISLFIANFARHNGFLDASLLSGKILSTVAFVIYQKLSSLSQYTIKSAQIGKITNLMSNDISSIQIKSPVFFASLVFPIGIIGVIAILVTRFGPLGLVSIGVTCLIFPIQLCVSRSIGIGIQKMNLYKDQRIKITTEIIQGIKFIKIYGWEIAFRNIIQKLRQKQISAYIKLGFGKALQRALGNTTAAWSGFLTLVCIHYFTPGELNQAKIFSLIQIMTFLRYLVFFASIGYGFIFQLNVIFERFINIYNIKNRAMIQIDPNTKLPLKKNNMKENKNLQQVNNTMASFQIVLQSFNNNLDISSQQDQQIYQGQVRISNFNGYWNKLNFQQPHLNNLNLYFKKGHIYGIGGKVGSGKSGLLGCILKQIPYFSGKLQMKGKISYVQQQPIVFSATIKQNILFGRKFDKQKYKIAVEGSCLASDFQILQDGDETIVGQRGVTLSGGQKARVALARALYEQSDIYLFDDPLSAVDSKVSKIIFQKTVKQILKGKTIILVTHQVHYLQQCDQIVILDKGKLVCFGKPQNIIKQLEQLKSIEKESQQEKNEQRDILQLQQQQQNEKNLSQNILLVLNEKRRKQSLVSDQAKSISVSVQGKITYMKKQQDVQVTMRSYMKYIFFNKVNWVLFPINICFFIAAEAVNVVYLRYLATYQTQINQQLTDQHNFSSINAFWGVMGLLVFLYFIFLTTMYFLLNLVVLKSNQKIHQEMLYGMVRSPCSFFDISPSGQLISKFSNDLGILDNTLSYVMIDVIQGPIISIIMVSNIFSINLYFLIPGIINMIFIVAFFLYCKNSIIQAKQMDLRSRSPMLNDLSEMLTGIIPLNVYGKRLSSLKQFSIKLNDAIRSNYCFWIINRAFGVYLSYCSVIIMLIGFVIGIPIAFQGEIAQAGLYGISVVFLVQINDYLQWFLRQIISMESIMVSVQRSFYVTNLKSEAQLYTQYDKNMKIKPIDQGLNQNQSNTQQYKQWPSQCKIQIKNFSMKYRVGLPLVLKNLKFKIFSNEKVGIVGRTGAGKSSIIQALMRISQPSVQSIYLIDQLNVLQMGLHTLRQNISVIPQTPFLFRGTIKENLDPFKKQPDSKLWNALQQSGLKDYIESLPEKLETDISNSAQIFSVGQKQLICLARALIRKSKILFLDQATSNVDMRTDQFIQNVLKQKFNDCTIITIAHRLNTVADYDKVIVMHKGRIKQIGSPYELIQKQGIFYEMVENTGKNAMKIKQIAKQTFIKKQIKSKNIESQNKSKLKAKIQHIQNSEIKINIIDAQK